MTAPNLWIAATTPPGQKIGFGLSGDSQATRSGSAGGWQIVDRPRRAATTEWVDYGPLQLTMSLVLDGYSDTPGALPISIEAAIAVIEGWELPAAGTSPPLPPILSVTGPVPHNDLPWVAQQIVWKEAIRDRTSGVRYQQNLDVVLWQYLPAVISTQTVLTPAAAARAAGGSSGGAYTVKTGDTLQTIAAAIYGSYTYWTLLANANDLRSSTAVTAGQVLTVPAKTATAPALAPIAGGKGSSLTLGS